MTQDPDAARRQALYDELRAGSGAPARSLPTPADIRRRRVGALVIAATLLLTGGGIAIGLSSGGGEKDDGNRLVVEDVPLPPGYAWPPIVVESRDPLTGAPLRYPSERAAKTEVTLRALCAWWASWSDAHAAKNVGGEATALDGHARVLDLVPRLEGGAGADVSVLDEEERLRREAREGQTSAIAANVSTNCTSPLTPIRAP